jgi:uncharacterized protein (TIGR02271 family)
MASSKKKDETQVDAKAGGAAVGGATGAVVGAAAGGPVGAAVGAVAGAAAGGLAGATLDDYEGNEPEFRKHWESSTYRDKYNWDDAAPAYRYGWQSFSPEHSGRSWTDVSSNLKSGWKGKGKFEDYEPMIRTAWERRAQARIQGGGEAVVPVVEEELKVGKRTVEGGGVRVSTHVTETPVEENVQLHEERVKVERRPASRTATAADTAFKEGTIEVTERSEEAVVTKQARVIEEVVISKEARDRTETVKDTVRRTDVDVEEVDTPKRTTKTSSKTVATGSSAAGFDTFDADFQKAYKSKYAKSGYTYEQFSPAYRYGYHLANDERYNSGDWSTVEPQARTLWEQHNKGTWEEFKDAIHYAWDKVRGAR